MNGVLHRRRPSQSGHISSFFRITLLLLVWAFIVINLGSTKEVEMFEMMIVTIPRETAVKKISLPNGVVTVHLNGPINKYYTEKRLIKDSPYVAVRAEWRDSTLKKIFVRSHLWKVYLSANLSKYTHVHHLLQVSPSDKPYGFPGSAPISVEEWGRAVSVLSFESHSLSAVGLHMVLDKSPREKELGVISSIILIIVLYAMIISDFIDRRFGSVVVSMAAISLMALLGRKPSFETLAKWIDLGTLMVLLGSMIMVALLWETGFFDYITMVAYKTSKGHAWLLIYIMCMISALLSAFLDNCTVVLLLAPPAIKLCEATFLNTQIVLIIVAVYANIGGSMTPVGGPANILIVNRLGREEPINFSFFTANMLPIAVICFIAVYALIFLCVGERLFRVDENQIARKLAMKQPTQEILDRMEKLRKRKTWIQPVHNYYEILATVEANQQPMNLILLAQVGIAFIFLFAGFFLRSTPHFTSNASFGWISMLAAFLLLIMANKRSISPLLARIEWGILIYITCLFIITEVTVELGLITSLGDLITNVAEGAPLSQQTIYSMIIVLWMSGVTSAFLDDTPVSAVFLKVCIEVAQNETTNVPIMSLVWALVLGANYGGIGTMLGSISNEFVEVIAKDHGYKLSFMDFFYIGFPLMIVTLALCTVYLLAAQAVIGVKPVFT